MPYSDKNKRIAYRHANSDRISARDKAYRKANAEKIKLKNKAYKKANAEKIKAYYRDNRQKLNANGKVRNATYRLTLVDHYIAKSLRLPYYSIPPELIKLKRAQLQFARKIKEMKK